MITRVSDPNERQRLLNILNDVDGFQKNISKLAVETIMNPDDQSTFKKLEKMLNDCKFKVVALQNGLSKVNKDGSLFFLT